MLQALNPVMPDHEPQLKRSKTPSQLDMPIPVIDDGSRLGRLIPQILRQDAEGLDESSSVRHPETTAIEICSHPLMRIEIVAVGVFDAVLQMTKLRTHHRRPRHRRIHM